MAMCWCLSIVRFFLHDINLIYNVRLKAIISTRKFSNIVVTSSGAILLWIFVLELFGGLIEMFGFGMTGVSLSLNNKESWRESDIKIVGTDFDSSCEGKSNSGAAVSTSSVLTYYESELRVLLFITFS